MTSKKAEENPLKEQDAHSDDDEILHTFDMYGHLSRPTVILALIFLVLALLLMVYAFLTSGHNV